MSTPHNYLVGKIRRFSQCHTIKWRGSVTGGAPVALFISEKNNCKQNLGKKSAEHAQTSKHAIGQHPDSKTIIRTLKILAAQMQSTCQISNKKTLQPIQTHGAGAQITTDLQLAKIFPINLSKIAPNMWDVV